MDTEVFNIDVAAMAQSFLALFPLIIGVMVAIATAIGVTFIYKGLVALSEMDESVMGVMITTRGAVRKSMFYTFSGMMLLTISYQTAISQNTIFPIETDVPSMASALDQSLANTVNQIQNGETNNLFHNHLAAAVFAATTMILGFYGFVSGWVLLGKKGDPNYPGQHEIGGWKLFNRMFFGLLLMNSWRLLL